MSYDVDAANARWVAARDDLDWDAACADLDQAQALLQQAAATLSEEMFQASPAFGEWLAGRTADYHTHAAQLEEWIRA
ncbi:MAG: hypothetical protein H3C34_07270 [Caldilineaceae bacterium]|nr:hypothetical protein [Caldilineaceae bacterium]